MSDKIYNILLVEDNPDDVEFLKETLKSEHDSQHFHIEHVERLEIALKTLEKKQFDAVLLDLGLPDSFGINTVEKLHAHAQSVPIIVLTGDDDENLALKAMKTGGQDYLIKGKINGYLLIRAILYAIERQQLQGRLEKTRVSEKENKHKLEELRNHQYFLAISEDEFEHSMDKWTEEYNTIVLQYVRALRMGEERPKERVRDFGVKLSDSCVEAKKIIRLHLSVLDKLTKNALISESRAFGNDARLVLIEVMGNIIDHQLRRIQGREDN